MHADKPIAVANNNDNNIVVARKQSMAFVVLSNVVAVESGHRQFLLTYTHFVSGNVCTRSLVFVVTTTSYPYGTLYGSMIRFDLHSPAPGEAN